MVGQGRYQSRRSDGDGEAPDDDGMFHVVISSIFLAVVVQARPLAGKPHLAHVLGGDNPIHGRESGHVLQGAPTISAHGASPLRSFRALTFSARINSLQAPAAGGVDLLPSD